MNTSLIKKIYQWVSKGIKTEGINKIRISTILGMLLKTTAFLAIIETSEANNLMWSNVTFQFSLVQLSFIVLIFSFGYLFSHNKQIKFYTILNIAYTFMLILDLWYFRGNRDFFGLKNIFFRGTFNPLNQSLFRAETVDLIFVIDIILIILWIKFKRIKNNERKSVFKFKITVSLAVVSIIISYLLIDVIGISTWDKKVFKVGWSSLMTVRVPGPLGYHGFEAYNTITKILDRGDKKEIEEVNTWLSQNKEDLKDNEYKGMLTGKNVIFLQLESFENFIINKKANGKEITPFLNRLTREGLYFNNIYEQNNGGNSIDCDLMVNSSIFPLGGCITALNYGEVVYQNSLPRLLKRQGYTTIATHAEEAGEFNWTELHKNGFGMDRLWDISQYDYEETVGYGLSDRSFLSQLAGKIKTLPEPFYIEAPTMSSHGPFNIDKKYRQLNLPKEIDESYLGGYFESAHYTDTQIEMFFNKLNEQGILDNTVVVMYGDHTGVHKYYNEEIQKMSFEGDWWKPYDHKIPLIMYSKAVTPNVCESSGGQVDIMPTVAYLLGIDDKLYRDKVMGRVLINTQIDATVIKGNEIKGTTKNKEEEEHLKKAYEIGEKIIKNGFFDKE